MHQYYIWTVGCQMNQAESERLNALLTTWGWHKTEIATEADIVLLNSCVVRQSAQDRVVSKLRSLKEYKGVRPEAKVAVTGCLVDSDVSQLHRRFPHVDFFFQPGKLDQFSFWAMENGLVNGIKKSTCPNGPTYFVPIIQGCSNFCSYCIVPHRRGPEHSRQMDDITREVNQLVSSGIKEVTLLGQNVNSYGHDIIPSSDLAELLKALNQIDGLIRIRFLTNHPKDMSNNIISAVAELYKVCNHINLPLQAGDDDVLKAMKRGYTAKEYSGLVAAIRKAIPDVALATDIIVGFPGETEEQFQRTYDLIKEIRFDTVHTAMYSPRPGTHAARKLKDSVSPTVKKQRQQLIEKLQETISGEINATLIGKTVEILVEGRNRNRWYGRTRSNKLVFFEDKCQWQGQLVDVKIEQSGPWWLLGKTESNPEKAQ